MARDRRALATEVERSQLGLEPWTGLGWGERQVEGILDVGTACAKAWQWAFPGCLRATVGGGSVERHSTPPLGPGYEVGFNPKAMRSKQTFEQT